MHRYVTPLRINNGFEILQRSCSLDEKCMDFVDGVGEIIALLLRSLDFIVGDQFATGSFHRVSYSSKHNRLPIRKVSTNLSQREPLRIRSHVVLNKGEGYDLLLEKDCRSFQPDQKIRIQICTRIKYPR